MKSSKAVFRLLLAMVFLATAVASQAAEMPALKPLKPAGMHFQDDSGATVLLRGVGASGAFKTPPFKEKFKPQDLDLLAQSGVNVIRLVFLWEAYEAQKGKYDEKYLDWFHAIVKEAGARGIRTVLDFHQDAFSRYANRGCGSGFPEWAVVGKANVPDNSKKCGSWGTTQLTESNVRESFKNLYSGADGKDGVREHFLAVWERLALKFKDEPALLGFDLFNEPHGNWEKELLPLYEEVAKRVQPKAPGKILFLEPPQARIGGKLKKPAIQNIALAPHYYDLQILTFGKVIVDNMDSDLDNLVRAAREWDAPLFLGEFSSPFSASDEKKKAGMNAAQLKALEAERGAYMDKVYAAFNKRFFSAAQWVYTPTWDPVEFDGWNGENVSITDDKGNFRHFRPRPFPERVPGKPIRFEESVKEKSFTLEWEHNPKLGRVVVFAPQKGKFPIYPAAKISVEPKQMECAYDADGIRVMCESALAGKAKLVIQ